MIDADLKTYLQADAAVTAALGTRIYVDGAPQGASRPYCVFFQSGGSEEAASDGPIGLVNATFLFEVYGDTTTQARTAAKTIVDRLNGTIGVHLDTTWIEGIFAENHASLPSAPSDDDQDLIPCVMREFSVMYQDE